MKKHGLQQDVQNLRKCVEKMLRSMTGFGRSEIVSEERKLVVEIKAVNHRYCEISMKMPKKLGFLEGSIRSLLKEYIGRGKVDVFIVYEDYVQKTESIKYNREVAAEYYSCLQQMAEDFGLEHDIGAYGLSQFPDVFTLQEQGIDEEHLWQLLEEGIREAAKQFVEARLLEGERLKADLCGKLKGMLEKVAFIEERSPEVVKAYREKLTEKVQELLGDTKLDESVLATELAIFADKICVDEETVRLRSHIATMEESLELPGSIGRKLDFIAQEMNREANTILSKANDIELSSCAIDLKTEIEKVREQIQNIE